MNDYYLMDAEMRDTILASVYFGLFNKDKAFGDTIGDRSRTVSGLIRFLTNGIAEGKRFKIVEIENVS